METKQNKTEKTHYCVVTHDWINLRGGTGVNKISCWSLLIPPFLSPSAAYMVVISNYFVFIGLSEISFSKMRCGSTR